MEKNISIKLKDLTNSINTIKWFSKIGNKFDENTSFYISQYINFFDKDLSINKIKNWEEATKLLNGDSWNKKFWEKEENERINLYKILKKNYTEKSLSQHLGNLTNETSNILAKCSYKNLSKNNTNYDYYSRVAIGSAAICCYQTALTTLTNQKNHFFISKFNLFKLGFWPLVITENTFNIF